MNTFEMRTLEREDSFKRFLVISLSIHAFLFFGFTLKNLILPSETLIIENAIRVDMVALPDKAEPEVGPSPEPVKPAPIEKPKSKAEPEKTKVEPEKPKIAEAKKPDPKKAQQEALNKLKQKDAMDRLMKSAKSESAETKPATPVVKKNLNAGNQLSRGDSVTGLERIAFDEYISQVKGVVNSNFSVPNWLLDTKFKASVEVTINADGKILNRTLTKSSGNSTIDNAALAAVDASNPFPPAPERLTRGWGSFTIQFNFPDNS